MIDEERQPDDLENEPFVMPEYVDEAELPPLTVTPEEPILTALLRESLSMNRAGDAMMNDFAEWVLPQIVRGLTGTSAKGGDFALEKAAAGSDTERYQYDQSLRAHILNGLFAMLRIYDAGQQWGSTATDDMGDYGRRLIIAGYILHDYNKMPDVKEALRRQFDTEQVTPSAAAMPTLYRIIREQAAAFNLPEFFQAGGYELSPHDLIYVIHNTQGMWGTIPEYLLEGSVTDTRTVGDAREFTQIADLLAYGTFLEAGTLHKINIILGRLDMPFKLSAHRITQVTGIVTAYLHNAVVAALTDAGHVPILFAPNGVIYASPKNTPVPDLQQVARQASLAVQQAAMDGIERLAGTAFAVGIAWGTQGLKTAPFIDALYTPDRVLALVWKRLSPRLLDMQPRKREQLKVYKKLESGLKEGWQWFMADRIAELTAFMDERAEALADWLAYAYAMDARSESNNTEIILNSLDFDIGAETDLITTAQKGGVQFWPYLLALRYIQRNPTLAPQEVDMLVNRIIDDVLAPRFTAPESTELSQHVEQHAAQVVLLPRHGMEDEDRERFRREIAAYAIAKTDNKRGAYDTLYNIPFGVEQQQEATLPYMPTPYSQRLPLGSSDALGGWRRGISGVGVANMLLMQTALRQPFQFEDRKGKWLYLYPVYYFTPETGDALLGLTQRLQYFDLNEWLKHTEYGLKVDGQTVGAFGTLMQKPSSYAPPVQALRYGSNHTPTLLQIAVDPGKDATDGSSWINAIFMALLIASVVDVKVVVSESPSPLYASGVAFTQTVLLDAPHAAIADLIGRAINIDHVLPTLHRFTIAAAILRDAYGYDLPQFVRITNALSIDSAYAFDAYRRLSEDRESRGISISGADAQRYVEYVRLLDLTHPLNKESAIMNHARELVKRYRTFYRARGYAANAILRPIQAAAETILKSGPANDDLEMLVDAVTGRLIQIDNAIMNRDTEGYTPKDTTIQERQIAMRDFAEYFVMTYFRDGLQSRKTNLRGDQFNVLRLACDAVYRALEAEERANNPRTPAPESNESENE